MEGSFFKVLLIRNENSNVAVKQWQKEPSRTSSQDYESTNYMHFIGEITDNPIKGVVRYQGVENFDNSYSIRMEYAGRSLHHANFTKLKVLNQLYEDMSATLSNLENRGFVHCDLTPSNITVKREGESKFIFTLIDFSSVTLIGGYQNHRTGRYMEQGSDDHLASGRMDRFALIRIVTEYLVDFLRRQPDTNLKTQIESINDPILIDLDGEKRFYNFGEISTIISRLKESTKSISSKTLLNGASKDEIEKFLVDLSTYIEETTEDYPHYIQSRNVMSPVRANNMLSGAGGRILEWAPGCNDQREGQTEQMGSGAMGAMRRLF